MIIKMSCRKNSDKCLNFCFGQMSETLCNRPGFAHTCNLRNISCFRQNGLRIFLKKNPQISEASLASAEYSADAGEAYNAQLLMIAVYLTREAPRALQAFTASSSGASLQITKSAAITAPELTVSSDQLRIHSPSPQP